MCPLAVHPVQSCGRLLQLGDAQLQGINVTEGSPHPLLLVDHDSTGSSSGRPRSATSGAKAFDFSRQAQDRGEPIWVSLSN